MVRSAAGGQNMHMADYKTESLSFLRHLVDKTEKTPTELARLVPVSQTTLTRPLNSKDHKYAVKFQTLQTLSEKTGIPLPESLITAQREARGSVPDDVALEVRHEVAAGGFLRRDDLRQEAYGFHWVKPIAPFEFAEQWLERVVSDSMNRRIPEGSLIHVVSADAIRYRPKTRDIVVIERSYSDGAYVERTVKEVELTADGPEFWPRSYNPRFTRPISLVEDERDDVTVRIVGKVIQAYMFDPPEAAEDDVRRFQSGDD